jgi:hypothetical protein
MRLLFLVLLVIGVIVTTAMKCGEGMYPVPVLNEADCAMFLHLESWGQDWMRARFLLAQTYLLEDIALSLRALASSHKSNASYHVLQ